EATSTSQTEIPLPTFEQPIPSSRPPASSHVRMTTTGRKFMSSQIDQPETQQPEETPQGDEPPTIESHKAAASSLEARQEVWLEDPSEEAKNG
ncbi:MAG: hypothetical protein MK135_12980, partial [Polyangiaceae bacterium]|nr:hypothetical protein [Polyangiaceae bacterium]